MNKVDAPKNFNVVSCFESFCGEIGCQTLTKSQNPTRRWAAAVNRPEELGVNAAEPVNVHQSTKQLLSKTFLHICETFSQIPPVLM